MAQKKYKLQKTQNIGSPDAETDDNLLDVFVPISNVEEIIDTTNQASILIGRTGSGKSAIIRYLKNNCEHVTEIEPEAMSLRFLSNSTILNYFKSLNVNLTLFYKVLWKHVFIVELLKMCFHDDLISTEGHKFKTILNSLRGLTKKKDPQKDRALKYLESWSGDFWKETEYRIKSFEQTLMENYASSLGVNVGDIDFSISEAKSKGEKYLFEAKSKAEKVIQDSQSNDLLQIIDIIKEGLFNKHQKKFYLVIDDLDQEWIEQSFRYELIGAMIEVIKEFRKLSGVKIIISLRENLNDLVFLGIQNRGGQREKYKPLYSTLSWTDEELKELLNNRLKNLSNNEFVLKKAFKEDRRNKKSSLSYVLERTYKRPRDIISFINHAIENANNKSFFSSDIIAKAEPLYSLDRFQALEDEWGENYGQFSSLCGFLNGIHLGFQLKSVNEDNFTEAYVDESIELSLRGELLEILQKWKSEEITYISFLKKLLFIFYRIGIVGIKKDSIFPTAYFYDREVLIKQSDISHKCKFYVHPSLYSYFKVNTLELLPEN